MAWTPDDADNLDNPPIEVDEEDAYLNPHLSHVQRKPKNRTCVRVSTLQRVTQTPINPENPKAIRQPSTERQEAYARLRASGMPTLPAAKVVGLAGTYPYHLDKVLKPVVEKYRLDSARKIKLASSAVESLVQGQPVGKVEFVKDSTVLRAAEAIFNERSRRHPEEGGQADGLHIQLIDLSGFSVQVAVDSPKKEEGMG
ncbi:MAG: hypothetical protein NUW09_07910 [Deltaproteobacteria bacterium]|nr:hypothetical protein [Deltaproteobacteria bacterium]